jgi:hypothetical protein
MTTKLRPWANSDRWVARGPIRGLSPAPDSRWVASMPGSRWWDAQSRFRSHSSSRPRYKCDGHQAATPLPRHGTNLSACTTRHWRNKQNVYRRRERQPTTTLPANRSQVYRLHRTLATFYYCPRGFPTVTFHFG